MLDIKDNFPLSKITTLKIGGPAKQFVTVTSTEQLIEAITWANTNQQPYMVVGGGSNLLISDSGVEKLVIKNEIEGIEKEVRFLKVQSGTPLQHVVDFSIAQNLSGLQKLTGIPGTVGGAVFGNAGAYGQTISDHLREAICFDGKDTISLQKEDCEFNYRDSIFKRNGFVILELVFKFDDGDTKKLRKEADETLEKRLVKYPAGIKCPGSFFKNLVAEKLSEEDLKNIPPDLIVYGKVPAGSLLEIVGAKGDSQGDIEIADYHANLFINKGNGNAKDFYDLAKKYKEKVKEKFGIDLEPEVQLINLPPLSQSQ